MVDLAGAWLRLDAARQIGDLVEQRAPFRHQLPDLAICVHDRGVVAATESLADFGKGQVG